MYKVIMILQRGGYSWGVMRATVMGDGNCAAAGWDLDPINSKTCCVVAGHYGAGELSQPGHRNKYRPEVAAL